MSPNHSVVLFLLLFLHCSHGEEPTVVTSLGRIRGTSITTSGRIILAFRGIPYAKAPVGPLRFQEPVPVDQWNDTLDAANEGPACVQFPLLNPRSHRIRSSEDCLMLNVYTLDLHPASGLRPVMLFIHGGGFATGSGTLHGPDLLLRRDIVLVIINYRLGPLGFLSTGDQQAPGNYGLLDQVLSLKWVKEHIQHFGGDRNSVTIFGESAGAASVHFHLLSPLSKGLFHRAIMQSGSTLCPWALTNDATSQTTQLAKRFNCTGSSREIVQCLRTLQVDKLITPLKFGPRVDAERNWPFMAEHPRQLLASGRFTRVPLIIGANRNEGALFVSELVAFGGLTLMERNPTASVARSFRLSENATLQVLQKYLKLGQPLSQQLPQIEQMQSDYFFFQCIDDTVQLHSQDPASPVFYYLYGHKGSLTLAINGSQLDLGVSHADELFLQFSNVLYSAPKTNDDIKVSQILTDLWTSFASTGKPVSGWVAPDWLPTRCGRPFYLEIDANAKLTNQRMPFADRLPFWRDILNNSAVC